MTGRDIGSHIKAFQSIAPATVAATTNGSEADLQGYNSAFALISIGAQGETWTSSNYNTFTIQGSNTSGTGFTALTTAMMISPATNSLVLDSASDASSPYIMRFRTSDYRYYRVVCTESGTISTGTPLEAIIIAEGDSKVPEGVLSAGQ